MNLLLFDSEEAWVQGAASLWRDRLRLNPSLKMCLPSGHTPIKIFAAMVQSVAAGQVSFRGAEIFALDEFGGLADDDEGRCAWMLRRDLVDHIDLSLDRFHTIDTDAPDLERVCRDYNRAIGDGFDLTLLGIGLNGHLGMNEPGSSPDSATRRVNLHATTIKISAKYLSHSQTPAWGVTVGLKQLLASKEVWLLAQGSAKAEAIKRAVRGEVSSDLPASLLREHPNCYFILDATAAALL